MVKTISHTRDYSHITLSLMGMEGFGNDYTARYCNIGQYFKIDYRGEVGGKNIPQIDYVISK